eukprot:TRINITY_DN68519_c0_g1_i1.p1 TRINITY_DN68519_c0_g1~~TRINITY_DN68519_c0_g1_i1.p1  ORF type:complete len:248 (+),score=29.90 TRINITY_DN68519_c0_g1_i1:51-794(+)
MERQPSKAERKAALRQRAQDSNSQKEAETLQQAANQLLDIPDLTEPVPTQEEQFHYLSTSILPHLSLGGRQASQDLPHLVENGLSYILNVTPDAPNEFEAKGLVYKRVDVRDDAHQDILSLFPSTNAFIDEAKAKKAKVLVHCHQGLSRSASFVLAYLIGSEKMNLAQALNHVQQRRPKVLPNGNFYYQLVEYEKQVLGLGQPSFSEQDYFVHLMVTRGWKKEVVEAAITDAGGDLPKARAALTSVG